MGVTLPGQDKRRKLEKLEKSTDQHNKRRKVKTAPDRYLQQSSGRHAKAGPLEDLGNSLVNIFPVELQYNIRATCRNMRNAVGGVLKALRNTVDRLLPENRSH